MSFEEWAESKKLTDDEWRACYLFFMFIRGVGASVCLLPKETP